jgi:hypothetical protein
MTMWSGWGHWLRAGGAEHLALLQLMLPLDLVLERVRESLVMQVPVLAFRCIDECREQPLNAGIAFDRAVPDRADDGPRHRHLDLAFGIVNRNGAIGFFQDDALEPLQVWHSAPVL